MLGRDDIDDDKNTFTQLISSEYQKWQQVRYLKHDNRSTLSLIKLLLTESYKIR